MNKDDYQKLQKLEEIWQCELKAASAQIEVEIALAFSYNS